MPADIELRRFAFPHELRRSSASTTPGESPNASLAPTSSSPTRCRSAGSPRGTPSPPRRDRRDRQRHRRRRCLCRARHRRANIRDYAVNTVPDHLALHTPLRRSVLTYRGRFEPDNAGGRPGLLSSRHAINDLSSATLGDHRRRHPRPRGTRRSAAPWRAGPVSAYQGTTGMGPLYTPFEDVLRVSDIVTLHSPLLPSTRDMIAAPEEFTLMERRPLLLDPARGGLVDEAALEGHAAPRPHHRRRLRCRDRRAAPGGPSADARRRSANFILTLTSAWASREAGDGSHSPSSWQRRGVLEARAARHVRPDRPADLSWAGMPENRAQRKTVDRYSLTRSGVGGRGHRRAGRLWVSSPGLRTARNVHRPPAILSRLRRDLRVPTVLEARQ